MWQQGAGWGTAWGGGDSLALSRRSRGGPGRASPPPFLAALQVLELREGSPQPPRGSPPPPPCSAPGPAAAARLHTRAPNQPGGGCLPLPRVPTGQKALPAHRLQRRAAGAPRGGERAALLAGEGALPTPAPHRAATLPPPFLSSDQRLHAGRCVPAAGPAAATGRAPHAVQAGVGGRASTRSLRVLHPVPVCPSLPQKIITIAGLWTPRSTSTALPTGWTSAVG